MTATEVSAAKPGHSQRRRRIVKRVAKVAGIAIAAFAVAVTAASFGYNLATDGPAPRPAHLVFAKGGGWDTRYLEWGTRGTPVVLVPGAFETADTFANLGPVLAENHRVFAIDLSGTGYSAPNPPFSAGHLADEIRSFLATEKLTGREAPVLVGHSAGAADIGIAALQDPKSVRGVVFLDGDATPLPFPAFLGAAASTFMPKLVVAGAGDPEMSHSDAALTAQKVGAPPPVYVPGKHLTMISSPRQVAAAIDSLGDR